ncbi:hypothetical protein KIW84_050109 [Lathyrus oleraceus]|uniref:Uncharacterized protein n=1 Tax=Pisum sativum TaxID=3888 RepID=A0A9D5AE72_PEA|nr:hypothetical protein KIW84_050109 [Pisum sativum]
MVLNTTIPSARSTSLRIIGALIAMMLLLWTIRSGYQTATEPRRQLYGQWISHVGVLIMLFGFLLLAIGLPIIADLFLGLSEELQYPEETDLHQSIVDLKVKVDACV